MDEKYKLIESCYKNILKSYANQIKNSESADSNISLQHTAFNNLNQLVNKGMVILDCGASPGGWSQAIVKKNTDFIRSRVFQSNTKSVLQKLSLCENMPIDNDSSAKHLDHSSIIAVDLLPMAPINGVEFICGDFLEGSVQEQIRKSIDGRLVGLILSDMAPSLSGIKVVDSEKSMVRLIFTLITNVCFFLFTPISSPENFTFLLVGFMQECD
ncbi:Ribosomal RNA large subunit methyltransferase E [Zancudomyces culisetae]|uniref:rRNA methyltransferase 2, mitochondrial n=1 Tax=Zancudomyces culisetae TaxID=1213189 RepID=A0A1R1PKT4_ZANCU|nr:Ribosomal RNA large subunit methyltransferase E [Zancudomyces culisetae]OMH81482.1 Ribosomal RNA large subunit methyltransferase E [Zancudomyces culisetae]|eukprot:OMH79592.1 Ribosomal RNA large subunit methyltransferase E [Zancudomyces culisetae]